MSFHDRRDALQIVAMSIQNQAVIFDLLIIYGVVRMHKGKGIFINEIYPHLVASFQISNWGGPTNTDVNKFFPTEFAKRHTDPFCLQCFAFVTSTTSRKKHCSSLQAHTPPSQRDVKDLTRPTAELLAEADSAEDACGKMRHVEDFTIKMRKVCMFCHQSYLYFRNVPGSQLDAAHSRAFPKEDRKNKHHFIYISDTA